MRAATCHEIADDPVLVAKVGRLYEIIEKGSNAKAMIFPWLPNSAVKAKDGALREVYTMISNIIEDRKASGFQDHDAVQVLIDLGDSTPDISAVSYSLSRHTQASLLTISLQFVLETLFAGIINTGVNACWSLMFLNGNPEWKAKAKAEVQSLIAKYSNSSQGSLASQLSDLSDLPPNAWEEEMPVMEAVIRETIRILLTGAALRRNIMGDLNIDGKVVERGAFMAYPVSSLHFDDSIYSDPFKFDPDRRVSSCPKSPMLMKTSSIFRYSPGREEDKKVQFGFLGWGAGGHLHLWWQYIHLNICIPYRASPLSGNAFRQA